MARRHDSALRSALSAGPHPGPLPERGGLAMAVRVAGRGSVRDHSLSQLIPLPLRQTFYWERVGVRAGHDARPCSNNVARRAMMAALMANTTILRGAAPCLLALTPTLSQWSEFGRWCAGLLGEGRCCTVKNRCARIAYSAVVSRTRVSPAANGRPLAAGTGNEKGLGRVARY
jgi:hypothetical protein